MVITAPETAFLPSKTVDCCDTFLKALNNEYLKFCIWDYTSSGSFWNYYASQGELLSEDSVVFFYNLIQPS